MVVAGGGFEYEFLGPYGPALLLPLLPAVLYALFLGCNASSCLQLWPVLRLPNLPSDLKLFSAEALGVVLAWLALVVALHLLLPGKRVQGVVLPDGSRLTYKLNAWWVLLVTYGAAFSLSFGAGVLDLGWAYDHFLELLTAAVLVSAVLSVYLYASSFVGGKQLAQHGCSGVVPYDFWMGRELNPRLRVWGSSSSSGSSGTWVDLKEFCELYPGLIGWVLLNLAMAHRQYQRLGYVTNSMWMVNLFALGYVADSHYNEPSILTTMDITTDGFGYMLAFGDLAWLPFSYCTQARFLADYPQDLSWAAVVAILAVQGLGYWVFRSANSQKDKFRRNPKDPSVAHLRTLQTARGTRLIMSGWWGIARHVNYFGDWIMSLAWCLPTGLAGANAVVPYFYCLYFAALLMHRERRDEASCRRKYGADWARYCQAVRWRIVPFVY